MGIRWLCQSIPIRFTFFNPFHTKSIFCEHGDSCTNIHYPPFFLRDPRTTALIFASGKLVCTGAKSEENSRTAARRYGRIIQKLHYKVKFKDFKIQNMVGSCDVKFPIRLEGLHFNSQPFSQYEPEMFPGLIYKLVEPKVVLLIFVSGKVVITGAKSREQIYEAFESIYPLLTEYRKT